MTGVTAISHDGKNELAMQPEKNAVLDALRQTIDEPTLANARTLESVLRGAGTSSRVFGRLNQKSSIDAAAESDRRAGRRLPGRQIQADYEGAGTCQAARNLPRSGWRRA